MKIEKLYQLFQETKSICTDSRKAKKNTLFFALKGENFNGNQFVEKAINCGCSFAIIDEKKYAINKKTILVENVLETLQDLANFHRKKLNIPVIAITGTNGKTTTKELIKNVLAQKYKVQATEGNFNNEIGVPLTLLKLKKQTEIAVIEMGANHVGEIARLCEIAEPDFGLITNIGKAHLEGFGSLENIKKAKAELFKFLEKNEKKIFINFDNKILKKLTKSSKKISYGQKKEYDISASFIEVNPYLKLKWKDIFIQTQLIGKYNFENVLASICIGNYFDISKEKIKLGIENYKPENNRSQFHKTAKNTLILDFYNANPTSMQIAIENFSCIKADEKMLILGDMLELGKDSFKEHKEILNQISQCNFKELIFIGKEFFKFSLKYPYIFFQKIDDFLKENKFKNYQNKFILLKASRGIQLEKLLKLL